MARAYAAPKLRDTLVSAVAAWGRAVSEGRTERGTALILGGGADVFQDVESALALFSPETVLCINDVGIEWPGPLPHWCSIHAEKFPKWVAMRAGAGREPAGRFWTAEHRLEFARTPVETVSSPGGGSGLLTIRVARKNGARRIVLAGMPMTKTAHYHSGGAQWGEAHFYHRYWVAEREALLLDTRSMSGWTREYLGAPTREWLTS